MQTDTNAASKISLFEQVEKLKAGKKIVQFKKAHPRAIVEVQPFVQYIAANETRILQEKAQMWPGRGLLRKFNG